jgi:hypothetical protein
MFEMLTQFFTSPQPTEEASLTTQKLERFRRVCSKKSHLMAHQVVSPVVDEKSLPDPWKSTHHVLEAEHSYKPMVIYPPESLLVEGTAEKFLTCKLNPLDEFKLQRESRRKEATLSGAIARFKTKKKKSA